MEYVLIYDFFGKGFSKDTNAKSIVGTIRGS